MATHPQIGDSFTAPSLVDTLEAIRSLQQSQQNIQRVFVFSIYGHLNIMKGSIALMMYYPVFHFYTFWSKAQYKLPNDVYTSAVLAIIMRCMFKSTEDI
jgi:hypothetical protein